MARGAARIGRATAVLAAGLALASLEASASARQGGGDELEHFERRVRPVLVESCLECHDPLRGKPKGGLDLSTAAGWRAGGDSGPVIVPGDPEASLLVSALRYDDAFLAMPPKGKLGADAIQGLVDWIASGAPDPRTGPAAPAAPPERRIDLEAARAFWAYTPLADPAPPAVRDAAWPANEIDRFVLARLEDASLAPSPPADRRTLLRRASFDLIGLPPTPEEVAAFEADTAPGAFERVVERLLASPHYGERWGRHWLDLARYSDSNGLDENLVYAHAWRYRDYVVDSFNRDVPYAEFLTEQLAGDAMPPTDDPAEHLERIVATGFLTLGPKMLAEQDKEKLRMDTVDEQVDLVGRVFMGQTLGCARCHDHKFDPVPASDYYALAGIFRSTSVFENLGFVSAWRERPLATPAELAARDAWTAEKQRLEGERAALVASASDAVRAGWIASFGRTLASGQRALDAARFIEAEDAARTNLRTDATHYGDARRTVLHTAAPGLQFAEWDVAPAQPGRKRLFVRYAAGEARPMRLLLDGAAIREDALAEVTGGFRPEHVAWREVATVELAAGAHVLRLERDGAVPHLERLLLVPEHLAGWPLGSGDAGLVPELVRAVADELDWRRRHGDGTLRVWRAFAGTPAAAWDDVRAVLLARLARGDDLGPAPFAELARGTTPADLDELAARFQAALGGAQAALGEPEGDARLRALLHGPHSIPSLAGSFVEASFQSEVRASLARLDAELAAHAPLEPPVAPSAMAAADEPEVTELPIHVRGSHLALSGEPIPRGFLSVLAHVVPWSALPSDRSGRLALAEWLCHPEHPLTSRVLVNRVWHHHFGRGLVATPSNFGARGEAPSHPELLDWLARRFVEDGGSLKALHRRILGSRTWQQSAGDDERSRLADPENRLLWRQNRRRLEAEAIRDALFAVAGRLDLTLGGPSTTAENRAYATNDQSANTARYDAPRRALYLPVIRNAMYPFFAAFDYGDPSVHIEARASTTVPTQALFLMNSPLGIENAAALAARVRDDVAAVGGSDRARLERLWQLAFQRAPRDDERIAALAYLDDSSSGAGEREERWQRLCQTVLACNEFVFLD